MDFWVERIMLVLITATIILTCGLIKHCHKRKEYKIMFAFIPTVLVNLTSLAKLVHIIFYGG